MTVFVTGATGLVASHVAELLRAEGRPVRALHRVGSDVSFLRTLGCDLVEGDVRDGEEALARAMAGCDTVVHAAAVTYADLPWPQVRDVNVGGAERVMRAAARAGATRAVHLSSVAAYGDPRGRTPEGAPTDGPLGARELYARSKREAEAVVSEVARASHVEIAIVRAAAVYGERDRLFTPKLARAFRFPAQFLLGDGRGALPAVYAGNLAAAVLAVLAAPSREARVRAYDLGDDHPVTQRDLYGALGRALGRPFRPIPLPRPLVLAAARAGDAAGLRIPDAGELPLLRTALLAMGPNPFGSARIRAELGWAPRFALEEALDRTARWVALKRSALGL